MNYIQEINAFYTRMETNPLSGSAANLWHVLMHVNNRAHWVKEFSVAASVLCSKSGLPLSTFKRARAELCEKGYILYQSRGTKAPVYQMVSLMDRQPSAFLVEDVLAEEEQVEREVSERQHEGRGQCLERGIVYGLGSDVSDACGHGVVKEAERDEDFEERNEIDLMIENYMNGGTLADIDLKVGSKDDHEVSRDASQVVSQDVSPLYKQNKTKQNFHSSRREASHLTYPFYQEHFGEPSKYIRQELKSWVKGLGDELVYEALKRTVENGKTTWRYTLGILKRWKKDGLKTVADVLTAEKKFRQMRMSNKFKRGSYRYGNTKAGFFYGNSYRNQREEVVPDWFWKHQEEQKRIAKEQRQEMLSDRV